MSPVTRRSLLIGGATVAAVALQPGIAQAHDQAATKTVPFSLNATVLDGGEQVTSLTLDTSCFEGIDPASLTTSTFTVHAKATSPIPIATGDLIFSEYDLDRVVTAVHLHHGKITLDLKTTDGVTGGGTLGYIVSKARNFPLTLVYTITQKLPLKKHGGSSLTLPGFVQGKVVDPEVDVYKYGKSKDGMNYRLYVPEGRRGHDKKPLIVWLHGGGEGGSLVDKYYDNEPQMRANRGALGFSTDEAQKIFGGAYVVAPQAESFWLENGPAYSPRVKALVLELVRKYQIDASRIYLAGCSNGGYLTFLMTSLYHDLFAAAVPICGVVRNFPAGAINITDAQLKSITTPSWIVCAKSDTTVPPVNNSEIAAALIPKAIFTEYDTVTWNGITYAGHWSWIYVARNDPKYNGQHVWQWMASKRLSNRR